MTVEATIEVRPARDAELADVLALWEAARSPYSSTPDNLAVVERLRGLEPQSLLVATRDGRVIGALIAAWDGWRGNMYRLAVAPEHRRQGAALALVRAGEERLRGRGARRVTALVGGEDQAAMELWRAAGYEHDELVVRFVRNL